MFDSCFHFKENSLKDIHFQSKLLKKHKIKKALCMYDFEKNDLKRKRFNDNLSEYKNLFHVPVLNNNDLKNKFFFKNINAKFLKINPRFINIRIENVNVYKKLFKKISKTNLTLLWCSLDSYVGKPCKINQLDFLSEIIPFLKKNKIIILHGGGTNILKYYERFRFCENVFLDLSYTFNHYYKTNLVNDFVFLANNFDKRIMIGSDYPTIDYKVHCSNLKNFFKTYRISKIKKNNIIFKNLEKISNE